MGYLPETFQTYGAGNTSEVAKNSTSQVLRLAVGDETVSEDEPLSSDEVEEEVDCAVDVPKLEGKLLNPKEGCEPETDSGGDGEEGGDAEGVEDVEAIPEGVIMTVVVKLDTTVNTLREAPIVVVWTDPETVVVRTAVVPDRVIWIVVCEISVDVIRETTVVGCEMVEVACEMTVVG